MYVPHLVEVVVVEVIDGFVLQLAQEAAAVAMLLEVRTVEGMVED